MTTSNLFFLLVANVGLPATMALVLPAWSRPHTYFGATVPSAFPDSAAGRRVLRRYRARIAALSLAGAALVVAGTRDGLAWLLASVVVQGGGLVWALARANAETRVHAVPPSSVREALLEPRRVTRLGLLALVPYLLLAAAAAVLLWQWDAIPERFPIHWGLDGQPNGWSRRSPLGVFGLLGCGALVCALVAALGRAAERTARLRSQAEQRHVARVLLTANTLVSAIVSLASVVTALQIAHGAQLVTVLASAGAFLVTLYAALATARLRTHSTAGPGDGIPDARWKWGLFYKNADDPALLVPRRLGLGYELNFGHREAWWCLVLVLASILVVLVLVARL